jgi:hypothetical protein
MKTPTIEQISNMVGISDIAAGLGVERTTVNSWITRGQLPEPFVRITGTPIYWWPTIEAWDQDRRTHAHP